MRGPTLAVGAAIVAGLVVSSGSIASPRQEPVKQCDPGEVEATVDRFIAAFNAGVGRKLDRLFAPKPYFRWYATDAPGRRVLPVAADRTGLVRYLLRRHALGERLTLRSVRVNGNTIASGRGWKAYGNFEMWLVREARGLPPTDYRGKGALHCYLSRPDQLIVWVMGREA